MQGPTLWAAWWQRRLARRHEIERAVGDMLDRYGAAARVIAHNSARRGGGPDRRFWRSVARRLRTAG